MRTQDIDIATCTGSVIDHGAHVMGWEPRPGRPVIFTSAAAVYTQDTAIRGGVPVSFPWFGPGREPGAPYSHGFARTATWRQVGNDVTDNAQTLTYRLSADDATDEYWPHRYWALLTARFAVDLTVSLAVTNLDTVPFTYEAALHTYLSVSGIAEVCLEGLDGVSYVDKAAGGLRRTQEGPVTFTGLTDRVYASPGPVTVLDAAGDRQVTVATSGARQLVVWNPGREKAAEIADLAVGEWERFVCVEAGCVLDAAVGLDPGQTHTLSTTISV